MDLQIVIFRKAQKFKNICISKKFKVYIFKEDEIIFFREVNGEENVIELSKEDCVEHMVPNGIPIQGNYYYLFSLNTVNIMSVTCVFCL